MAIMKGIEYQDASAAVRAVYDDIMAVRKTDWINDFWKVLANDPATLGRTWSSLKDVMAPSALDPLVKELLYIAVSITNNCEYCINSHTAAARAKGASDAVLAEVIALTAMANETNRLAIGYQVATDDRFLDPSR